ncbi:MAG: hypothetical protein JWL59_3252 [Chthoniobacteraceae bacterium]|nr:hypothetical protein [Chthoniobacteraceae bacterium]
MCPVHLINEKSTRVALCFYCRPIDRMPAAIEISRRVDCLIFIHRDYSVRLSFSKCFFALSLILLSDHSAADEPRAIGRHQNVHQDKLIRIRRITSG